MNLVELSEKLSKFGTVQFDIAHDEHRARFRPITIGESIAFTKYALGVLVERKERLRREGKHIDPELQNFPTQ